MISFIQKYIIYILLAVIAVLLVTAGIQYMRFLKADSTVKQQKITIAQQEQSLETFKQNALDQKESEKRQQEIKSLLAKFDKRIAGMSTGKCLEAEDEKVFTDIFTAFNDGLSQKRGAGK